MTVSTAIAIIVIADLALIATLAYVMSRASRLKPHVSASGATAPEAVTPARRDAGRRPQRPSRRLEVVSQ